MGILLLVLKNTGRSKLTEGGHDTPAMMASNKESQISARKYPDKEVEHVYQPKPGHGSLGDKRKRKRPFTFKDIEDIADQLEAKHLQQTGGNAKSGTTTLVNPNKEEKNVGLRIDLQRVIQDTR